MSNKGPFEFDMLPDTSLLEEVEASDHNAIEAYEAAGLKQSWQERARQWTQHKESYSEGTLWATVLGLLSDALEESEQFSARVIETAEMNATVISALEAKVEQLTTDNASLEYQLEIRDENTEGTRQFAYWAETEKIPELEKKVKQLQQEVEHLRDLHELHITIPSTDELIELRAKLEHLQQERDRLRRHIENINLRTYHKSDCVSLLDDESDIVLADFQECTCGMHAMQEENQRLKAQLARLVEAATGVAIGCNAEHVFSNEADHKRAHLEKLHTVLREIQRKEKE